MSRRRPAGSLLLFLVAALVASGCGGSDAPKSKDEFVAEADAVCERLAERFARAGATNPRTPEQIADSNAVLAQLYGELEEDLTDLETPPGADGAGARDYLAAIRRADAPLQRMTTASQALAEAVKGRNARVLAQAGNELRSALDEFRAVRVETNRLAVDYGLNSCGNLG